jgi:hypothetical protein
VRIRSWTAGLAIATAVLVAPPASAETINFDEPFAGPVLNECTGETFMAEGTTHFKFTGSSTLTGSKSQAEMNLTGVKGVVPLTGVRYVMNTQTSDMAHADFDPDGNAQQTMELTILITRQGDTSTFVLGDDYRLHQVAHLTVANGMLKSLKVDPPRVDCR